MLVFNMKTRLNVNKTLLKHISCAFNVVQIKNRIVVNVNVKASIKISYVQIKT